MRGIDSRDNETPPIERQRVEEFAKDWMASKRISVDAGTARTYAKALEHHVLPALGMYWYDARKKPDVQRAILQLLVTELERRRVQKRRKLRPGREGTDQQMRDLIKRLRVASSR